MNPFELIEDSDSGGIMVRVKNNFVIPTREEERRVTKRRITEIFTENERLRELCADMLMCINAYKARKSICIGCEHHRDVDELRSACFLDLDARNLGIKADK